MLDDSPGLGNMDATDHPRAGTGWDDFRDARDRFLARLAELSEINRLERAWALDAPSDTGQVIAGSTGDQPPGAA